MYLDNRGLPERFFFIKILLARGTKINTTLLVLSPLDEVALFATILMSALWTRAMDVEGWSR